MTLLNKIVREGPPFSDLYFIEEDLRLSTIEDGTLLLKVKVGVFFSKNVTKKFTLKKCKYKEKIRSNIEKEAFWFYKNWIEVAKVKNIFGPKGPSITIPDEYIKIEIEKKKVKSNDLYERMKILATRFMAEEYQNLTSMDKIKAIENSMSRIVLNQMIIIAVLGFALFTQFLGVFKRS